MRLLRYEFRKITGKGDLRLLAVGLILLLAAVLLYSARQTDDRYLYQKERDLEQYTTYRKQLQESGRDSALASLLGTTDDSFIQNDALVAAYKESIPAGTIAPNVYASSQSTAAFDLMIPLLLSILFMLVSVMTILTQEWEGDLIYIQRGLSRGGRHLYRCKILVVWLTGWALYTLLAITQFLILQLMHGWINWRLPLQSEPRFLYSALPFELWQGAVLIWLTQGLGLLLLSMLMVCLGCFLRQRNGFLITTICLLGIEYGLYHLILHQDRLHWLKELNVFSVIDATALWRRAVYIIIQKQALPWYLIAGGFTLILLLVLYLLGYLGWSKKKSTTRDLRLLKHRCKERIRPRAVKVYERRKLWWSQRLGLILLILMSVSVYTALQFHDYKEADLYYYNIYCRKMEGVPLEDVDRFIAEEEKRFKQIDQVIAQLYEQHRLGKIDKNQMEDRVSQLTRELMPRHGLERMKMEVQELKTRIGAMVIDQDDWSRIAGIEGMRDIVYGLVLFSLAMLLGLYRLFLGDQERMMTLVQTATPFGLPAVEGIKSRMARLAGWLAVIIVFLPLLIVKLITLAPSGAFSASTSFLLLKGALPQMPLFLWTAVLYGTGVVLSMLVVRFIDWLGKRGRSQIDLWGRVFGLVIAPLILMWVLLGLWGK